MRKAFLTFAISAVLASATMGNESSKTQSIGKILNSVQKIYNISQSSSLSKSQQEMHEAINQLKSIDQLVTFAVIVRNIAYPQNAGDEKFDDLFSTAFWHAAKIISEDRSTEGKSGLQELKQRVNLDGGDKLLFDNLVKQQSK